MFGWIHESFRQLVNRKYGKEIWLKIVELAKFEEGTESEISHYYTDEETMRLVNSMANIIGIPVEELWEAYGGFLIQFTMETGWDELLRAMASDLEVRMEADMKLSNQLACYELVKDGVVREVSRRIYDTEVIMKVQERKQEHLDAFVTEHVVFTISQVESGLRRSSKAISTRVEMLESHPGDFEISAEDFVIAFPYHICFDKQLVIEHVGQYIRKTYPMVGQQETKVTDILELVHPEGEPHHPPAKGTLRKSGVGLPNGAMVLIDGGNYILYVSSVNVATIRELIERNLHISDMQRHDGTRDLIMLNQCRMSQVELNRKLEETTKTLKKMANELEIEKQKTDELLCELMPASIADALRQGKTVEASEFSDCTLLFTDIVTFTNICAQCTPYDVVTLLNDLYLRFDRLIGLHEVYKVETIGDAYMVVGGVPDPCDNHSERVLDVSIGLLMESKLVLSPISCKPIKIRLGVHSGPVVAGVVGMKMPRYCLFGDSVNVANKMEACGVPVKIHVSESARVNALRTNPSFIFVDRGMTEIKGKGLMYTYFLEKNERKSVWELCARPRSGDQTIDGYLELHDASIYEDGLGNATNGRDSGKVSCIHLYFTHIFKEHLFSFLKGNKTNPRNHHVHSPTCTVV
ncbi:unnamed protein product [Angiostrongylus costaricensis]|uniref:guanylate cyclase n=1 Tax=Angiostrongylus costaricensis TaxID=334426 RepID=A0A158PMG8_ANGCS|nr:unnamed protein product [Angiostrongylus costaricensis]